MNLNPKMRDYNAKCTLYIQSVPDPWLGMGDEKLSLKASVVSTQPITFQRSYDENVWHFAHVYKLLVIYCFKMNVSETVSEDK